MSEQKDVTRSELKLHPSGHDPAQKLIVHLVPIGNAPTLQQSKFKTLLNTKFANVVEKACLLLKSSSLKHRALLSHIPTTAQETLYFYCARCFQPAPYQYLADLVQCFGTPASDDKLAQLDIFYSTTEIWV